MCYHRGDAPLRIVVTLRRCGDAATQVAFVCFVKMHLSANMTQGSFGVVYGINQRSDALAESFAGDGAGNAGNDAGSTWCRRYMQCEAIAR